jgi:hypothetical protein
LGSVPSLATGTFRASAPGRADAVLADGDRLGRRDAPVGRHATAFVSRQHFDDADLFEQCFVFELR